MTIPISKVKCLLDTSNIENFKDSSEENEMHFLSYMKTTILFVKFSFSVAIAT